MWRGEDGCACVLWRGWVLRGRWVCVVGGVKCVCVVGGLGVCVCV